MKGNLVDRLRTVLNSNITLEGQNLTILVSENDRKNSEITQAINQLSIENRVGKIVLPREYNIIIKTRG